VPVRAYALFIIAGIAVAVMVLARRLEAIGYRRSVAADIATWAVPFGLVGARLYHLVTDPELYWGRNGQGTLASLEIWHGGLGIWGGVAGGALGAFIACRRHGVVFAHCADALAPGLPLAQAVGRWGNYFNQELYGRPSGLPWAVHIDSAHRLPGYATQATYQPTFLYESLWDIVVALLVLWAWRRWHLDHGRSFALYVAAYTAGRGWIESLRIDHTHRFFGLRLNDWVSVVVFLCAVGYLVVVTRRVRRLSPAPPGSALGVATPPYGSEPGRTLAS
jgi:prolipoprotein diacylglyceryl transferase